MSEPSSRKYRTDNRKRKRPPAAAAWKKLPGFLDACASVSASTFGARRLPELRRLYSSSLSENAAATKPSLPDQAFKSGGCKTSCRHLRRRTTAIKTRNKFHRYPKSNNNSNNNNNNGDQPEAKSTTRKAKRGRRSSLCQSHYHWQHHHHDKLLSSTPPDAGEEASEGDKTTGIINTAANWTMTHVWHTKRFHMETLWGWRIPLCHTNRGARAILRLEKENRCAIQDITWKRQPISLSFSRSNDDDEDDDDDGKSLAVLIQMCRRICPDFGASKATLCGSQMGTGILHELDQFPCRAVGPAWWSISREKNDDQKRPKWVVQWMVHPSVRASMLECLQNLIAASPGDLCLEESKRPNCCLRISGSSATRILRGALALQPHGEITDKQEWDWNVLQHVDWKEMNEFLPHGSVIRVALTSGSSPDGEKNTTVNSVDAAGTNIAQHINEVQKAIEAWDPNKTEKKSGKALDLSTADDEEALLVWRSPRPLDCAANRAVSGWDLYVSPEKAKDIWMALEMEGSCCAIGMVEESHLHLECSPPLPVFPRDFVDTEQSALYWNASDSAWRTVRRLFEGGWGRLPVKQDTKLQPIAWGDLAPEDEKDGAADSDATTRLAIVRGAFGQPFVDAVTGCGHLPEISDTAPTRRKRRRVRPPNETFHANPLSNGEADQLGQVCKNLQASLSLPAALVCHVRSFGQRRVCTGTKLYHSEQYLGCVAAGEFSLSRGVCHGIAILGAARLLKALEASHGKSGCIVRRLNGNREVHLTVMAKTADDVEYQASVSLILK
jgi:hypothetical protein